MDKQLKDIEFVYFLGIGGIGMSALAYWFCQQDYEVGGYDKTLSPITDKLEKHGVKITDIDHVDQLPKEIVSDPSRVLIIYTPAIPRGSKMMHYFKAQDYAIKKRSEVLGMITKNLFTIGVSGTHGKTTTSSILVHILKEAGINVIGFMGGIAKNFDSNLVFDPAKKNEKAVVVVEADEYDRSFLQLSPNAVLVTSVDADHLDIYEDEEDFTDTFREFVGKLPEKGVLVKANSTWANLIGNRTDIKEIKYGLGEGDVRAENIYAENGIQFFDFVHGNIKIEKIELALPGLHNIENCIGAMTVALENGIKPEKIKPALYTYKGVKRRFEYIIKSDKQIFIDDYAHHPSEIEAFVKSVRSLFPDKKLTVAFQPHLFSRTRDFMSGFAEVLSQVDKLYLLDIYPARELPITGVTSKVLLEKITLKNKQIISKEELVSSVSIDEDEVFATLGAGDIDRLVNPIKEAVQTLHV